MHFTRKTHGFDLLGGNTVLRPQSVKQRAAQLPPVQRVLLHSAWLCGEGRYARPSLAYNPGAPQVHKHHFQTLRAQVNPKHQLALGHLVHLSYPTVAAVA